MANVFVSRLGIPKTFRDGRVYGGNSFDVTNVYETNKATDNKHIENGVIDDLVYDNTIFFESEFINTPIMVQFKLFRMIEQDTNMWVVQDVLNYHTNEDWILNDGFQFTIDPSESLTGVFLHYLFTE